MPRGVYERKPKTKTEDVVTEQEPDQVDTVDETQPAQVDGEICGQCWPAGWPEGGDAAACEHGTWTR